MADCIFCKIASGEMDSATIYEDRDMKVILDRFPSCEGHALVIPKKHYDNIFSIEPEVGAELFKKAIQIASVIKKEVGAVGMNILQNNGEVAGQTVEHFHIHIIPRNTDDGINIKWQPTEPTAESLNSLAERIKKAI